MNMDNEPRMQDRSPEGQMFAIESEIKNMMKNYEMAVADGDTDRAQFIADVIDRMQQMIISRQSGIANKMIAKSRPEADFYAGPNMASGGEASFPDLTGDGQVTQADILKGRGVEFAEGGEAIGDDLAGMAMSQEEAMAEVGNAEKEMAMIQQLVTVVQQLLAEGISEDDLVAFLKEQGLDDEDIDSLMQMVLQSQSTQAPDQIGQELQGMM
jgi:5'-3' exonuclease